MSEPHVCEGCGELRWLGSGRLCKPCLDDFDAELCAFIASKAAADLAEVTNRAIAQLELTIPSERQ